MPRTTAHSLGAPQRTTAGHTPMRAQTPPTSKPKFQNCLTSDCAVSLASIELKFASPVRISLQRRLIRFFENEVLEYQEIDLCSHEAAVSVRGRADDRLAANIEGCIDDHAAPGFLFKRLEQRVVPWVVRFLNCLDSR